MPRAMTFPTTTTTTVSFTRDDGTAFNPDEVVFRVLNVSGTVIATYVAGTDPEVVECGSPIIGRYAMVWTPGNPGSYNIGVTGSWTSDDGLSRQVSGWITVKESR